VPIYDVEDLILMSRSPLTQLTADELAHLREVVPEIVTSRRRRARWVSGRNKSQAEKTSSYPGVEEFRSDQVESWRKGKIGDPREYW